jgi:prepilin-type N-terminal cleavage/methylation domain-containing protein
MTLWKTQNDRREKGMYLSRSMRGFTLIEMLVAMAVTLLMMAALARAFAYVGRQVQESRADTQLASDLRDVTTQLHQDLARCTVDLTPHVAIEGNPNGYFMYYEGPVTNATSTLFRASLKAQPTFDVECTDSKYGDFDDYLAFTAVARGSQWFTGRVEKILLTGNAAHANKFVTLSSKYAEIVYFASPEYVDPSIANPVYVDVDGTVDLNGNEQLDPNETENGFPDRLRIYRRVLLIRPDLNGSNGQIGTVNSWPQLATDFFQKSDLSVRRGLNADGTINNAVVANALSDLSSPHNRFAHVRTGGTMARLDLSSPATILTKNLSVITNPNGGRYSTIPLDSNAPLGTLKPSYRLAGKRTGEDVLTNNALGFDLQIFDPKARLIRVTNPRPEVLSPSDEGYRDAMQDQPNESLDVGGCFVDLAFPILAGGSLRFLSDTGTPFGSNNAVTPTKRLETDFSGLQFTNGQMSYRVPEVSKSSHWIADGNDRYLLPIFDSYTSYYEKDGCRQFWNSNLKQWATGTGAQVANEADVATNGFDDDNNGLVDDYNERESLPTFLNDAEAVRVTVRLENPSLRFVRQASVEYRGK